MGIVTRLIRWSTTLAAAAGGFLVGVAAERLVVDWSTNVIGGVGLVLLAGAVVRLVFEWWLARDKRLADEADEWERDQDAQIAAARKREFRDSRLGKVVAQHPNVAEKSLRIEPVESPPRRAVRVGVYSVQISKTHVAHLQLVPDTPTISQYIQQFYCVRLEPQIVAAVRIITRIA